MGSQLIYNARQVTFDPSKHFFLFFNQMKNQKYYTIGTILKSNRKIVETGKIDTPNTYIHDRSLS